MEPKIKSLGIDLAAGQALPFLFKFFIMLNQTNVLKQTELCGRQFRVYGTPQEPLFKAQDVALMLSLKNVSDIAKNKKGAENEQS